MAIIGKWIETESREIRNSPSTYAADWETLKTRAGEYVVRLTTINGRDFDFNAPKSDHNWPYYVAVTIEADRIAGATYSGFGGLNFASRELPIEAKPLHVRPYAYELPNLIDTGQIVIDPNMAEIVAPLLADWYEFRARMAAERKEREDWKNSLSVYLQMRESRSGHEYAADVATHWHGATIEDCDRERAAGDALQTASNETMGLAWPERIKALRHALESATGQVNP